MPRRGYKARGGERGVSIPVFLDDHGGAVAFVATWRAASRLGVPLLLSPAPLSQAAVSIISALPFS